MNTVLMTADMEQTLQMSARLADVYGEKWNELSQAGRMKYVNVVLIVRSVSKATHPEQTP